MLPKKGKTLHRGAHGNAPETVFAELIASALKNQLGTTHQAVKTVHRWTGAGERTIKNWFAGTHGPSGEHLVDLARHSDEVLKVFLIRAHRRPVLVFAHIMDVRDQLIGTVELIDRELPENP